LDSLCGATCDGANRVNLTLNAIVAAPAIVAALACCPVLLLLLLLLLLLHLQAPSTTCRSCCWLALLRWCASMHLQVSFKLAGRNLDS
jgi:hypothetical protein